MNKERVTISLSRADIEMYASNHAGFCNIDISRVSSIFIVQIMQLEGNRVLNTYSILDKIKCLEGGSTNTITKPFSTFKYLPLKGLLKTHFSDASFLLKNLNAHFGYDYGGNAKLEKIVEEAFRENTSGFVDEEFIHSISHKVTIAAYEERATKKQMTGEWIIFQKYKGRNYYLTLAAHTETNEDIYKRVCDAYDLNFDFLRGCISE